MPRLNELYAENMRNHPYGYALYHPASTRVLYPGCVGYFDTLGNWHPVTHVETASAPFKRSTQDLDLAPQSTLTWSSPLCSSSVRNCTIGISSEVLPAGASCKFVSSTDFGAVLATAGEEVVRDAYYYSAPLREWLKDNAQALIKTRPEVRDRGVWVVATTYSTRKCSIAAWRSRDVEVSVGVKAAAAALGPLGSRRLNCNGTESAFEAKEERERLVVFVGGVRFTYSRILRGFVGPRRKMLSRSTKDLDDWRERKLKRGPSGTGGLERGRKRKRSRGTDDLEDEGQRERVFDGTDGLEHEYKFVVECSGDEAYEVTWDTVGMVGGGDTAGQGDMERSFDHRVMTRSRTKKERGESNLPDDHPRGKG